MSLCTGHQILSSVLKTSYFLFYFHQTFKTSISLFFFLRKIGISLKTSYYPVFSNLF